ncbi:MAG: phosphatidylserine/phosphatidylglycerophosphate/cardiolipinsynthase-like protein [Pseudonocardiales bacterium]|nr:phosphatidylserine/phosphatidylglycerophosphate/cardiolipinsynthase-like protein [Pseudonocardiales bacterium]
MSGDQRRVHVTKLPADARRETSALGYTGVVPVKRWFLSSAERGNPHTSLDRRHGGRAWTTGNTVRPLVHGAVYFAELRRRVDAMHAGDELMFTDWRGDADELLDGPGTEVSTVLSRAAERGVIVKGLMWRSHWDRFAFSAAENRHLGEEIEQAGGECVRDMRVRPGGSHHQKYVVLRHPDRPELDIAFAGGIDLCHSRNDDVEHNGDPQRQPMAAVYGQRPPWHDAQLAIHGPAVGDVEATFRERWTDPTPMTRNPFYRLLDAVRQDDDSPDPLPEQLADPVGTGTHAVQILRTYPARLRGYPFAPHGERSVARAYRKVVANASSLIYVEDQYFWDAEVVRRFADALADNPNLHLIAIIPRFPDQDGRVSKPPNLIGRMQAIDLVRAAGPGRVAFYGIENHAGTPVYVHAKVCVIDDVWASIGSDNVNRRSWTHDSELSCAVFDESLDERPPRVVDRFGDGARRFARDLRLSLAREHLDRAPGEDADLLDPASAFEQFAASAARLQAWHDGGRRGERPPGRLRPYDLEPMSRRTRLWAEPLYRVVYDPDGRPLRMRLRHEF